MPVMFSWRPGQTRHFSSLCSPLGPRQVLFTISIFSCAGCHGRPEMERIPEVLQFPVIVEREWVVFPGTSVFFRKSISSGVAFAPSESVSRNSLSPGSCSRRFAGFPLDELKFFGIARSESLVQYNFDGKRREVDIPGLNERIEEADAIFNRNVENVGIQKFEDSDSHFLVTPAAHSCYKMQPVFAFQFFFGDPLGNIQELLRDQPFQLAKWPRFKNSADFFLFFRRAFAQNQLSNSREQGCGWVTQIFSDLFLPLMLG